MKWITTIIACRGEIRANSESQTIAMRSLEREKLCSCWWCKLRDFVCDTKLDGLFCRKPKVIVIEVRPLLVRHSDVLPQDGLGPLIGKNGGIGEALDGLGIRGLSSGLRPMNHERTVGTDLSCSRP